MMKKNIAVLAAVIISLLVSSQAWSAIRKPERIITKNGMTVLLLERKALPFITVSVSIRAGSVFDPDGLSGLANITADLLTEGTKAVAQKRSPRRSGSRGRPSGKRPPRRYSVRTRASC